MLSDGVQRTIERYHLLDKGNRVVVGVSGGVDSMVLLRLLNLLRREYDLSLIVAHVHHGLRPEESKREAELVEQESNRLGLPFEYGQFDVMAFSRTAGLSLQDGARRIRFHFFKTLLLKCRAQKIALGHNADDQVETLLIRLFRGSGLKGLKGMLPIRDGVVIRPLLDTWRREIESFATENQIPYLTDSSNLKRDYFRNRLRIDLIPLVEKEYQANFKERIFKTSVYLREEDDYLERKTEEAYPHFIHEEEGSFSFRFSAFQSLHHALQWRLLQRVLGRVYRETSEEEEAWLIVDSVCQRLKRPPPSFLMELSHGFILEKRYDQVSIRKGKRVLVPPFEVEIDLPGRTRIKEIGKEVFVEEGSGGVRPEDLNRSPQIAFFDCERLRFPLRMRNFRPGDRFQPLGVKGEQKLKEFFIDHKIPRFERPGVPLLVSGETIIWVVGHRISEQVKVTEETKRVLRVEVV